MKTVICFFLTNRLLNYFRNNQVPYALNQHRDRAKDTNASTE